MTYNSTTLTTLYKLFLLGVLCCSFTSFFALVAYAEDGCWIGAGPGGEGSQTTTWKEGPCLVPEDPGGGCYSYCGEGEGGEGEGGAPTPGVALVASPSMIESGESSTLFWVSGNVTSCTSSDFDTGGATSGSVDVSPSVTTVYTIECTGDYGPASDDATVSVGNFPNLQTSAVSPNGADDGETITFTAQVTNVGSGTTGAGFHNKFQWDADSDHTQVTYPSVETLGGTFAEGSSGNSYSLAALGASQSGTISFRMFVESGVFYLRACADDYSTISETNEGDNCGPWTAVSVDSSGANLSCSVDNTGPESGEDVTYTATPGSGVSSPYHWQLSNSFQSSWYDVSETGSSYSVSYISEGTAYLARVQGTGMSASEWSYCPTVYVSGGGDCSDPDGDLSTSPTRVRQDTATPVTFSYEASGAESCTVSGPGVNQGFTLDACALTNGSFDGTVTISTQAAYTLTCDGEAVDTALINVIPQFEEF